MIVTSENEPLAFSAVAKAMTLSMLGAWPDATILASLFDTEAMLRPGGAAAYSACKSFDTGASMPSTVFRSA